MKTLEIHGRILFDVIWSRNTPKQLLDKFFLPQLYIRVGDEPEGRRLDGRPDRGPDVK
jgi:hypothetical protein